MNLTTDNIGDITVVALTGEYLDASTVKEFKAGIEQITSEGSKKVIFDMSNLQFIDSSGLGAILSCLRKLNGSGGDLKICGMTKPVRALFELVRMHRIVEIYDSQDEALKTYE